MKHSIVINRFDGGLNTKVSALQGELNESPDLLNVEFDDLGAVATRNGISKVNSSAASGAFDLLHSYRKSSGAELVAVYGDVNLLTGTAIVAVSGSTGMFSAGVRVHAENCQNYLFLGNGTAKYKFNGTDFTLWGVPTATTAFITALSDVATAVCNVVSAGIDIAYRIALINSTNVESPATLVKTHTVTDGSAAVKINFNDSPASHGVNYVAVYRNDYLLTAGTESVGYVLDRHETLTEARDTNIADRRPPAINIFLYHVGYMFGATEYSTNIYYSEINTPEAWPSDHYIRVGDGDGYTIRAIAIYNNGLVIAKEDGNGNGKVFVLYMPDSEPDNWSLSELDLAYGSISPKAICRFSNFLMLLNKNGIFDISQAQMGVMNSTALSWEIEPDVQSFVSTYLTGAVAVMFKNKVWVSVPYSSGTSNNRIYQYDFVRGRDQIAGAWGRHSGIGMKDLCVHAGILYGAGYDGHIYKLDYGTDDDGSAIESYFKTMHIHGKEQHRDNTKVWRYALVTLDTSGNWNVDVSWNSDYGADVIGTYSCNVDNGATLWGTMIWGSSRWGGSSGQKVFKIPLNIVSKSIQLKIGTNAAGQYFKLYKISLHYSLRGVR
jgi:hypothetical protein